MGALPRRWTRAGRAATAAHRADSALVEGLVDRWARACEGTGIAQTIPTVTGPTTLVPKVVDVTLTSPPEPLILIVRLLPGQLPADITAAAHRLAPWVGGRALRVVPMSSNHVRIEVLRVDPLEELVELEPGDDAHIGRTEAGESLRARWADMPHVVAQGVTRSGKSAWLYAQLAQLAARRGEVLVAGSDPSGLLWRPWGGHRQPTWRISGLADIPAHAELLRQLVADMDRRIRLIAPERDTVDLDRDTPLIVVVLEEYPGLLRAAEQHDPKVAKSIRGYVSRLLAESHKAGYRVVMVAQRAEANVIGGFERAMCQFRLSFRVDAADSIRLLHPSAAVDRVDEQMTAPDGVALLTAPGRDLVRLRGPWLGGYGAYARAVTG